ncbi:MAG: transcriptional regulator [Hirschia sp.]|nr:transcriptional regulator [Hirschia sp.]MBB36296.1 transcriptional regulator [Hirschia sp.]MBF17906.1 transcriptional regulator [Hirschia sp.]|tara:strand:- start:132 stop:335 length:204 start_codon:yes stop_codon:yes gene_type:complete
MDIRKRAGANIRRLRNEKGWSQEELAERTGLHRTYISSVERGVRNPTITVIEKLMIALKCDANAIFG